MKYVDLYLLPVPTANLAAYREQAQTFGDVIREFGGLSYREFKIDAEGEGSSQFVKLVPVEEGEILTSAMAEFESKAHRDEVMSRVMADERVKAMEHQAAIGNMDHMFYAGFDQFIEGQA